MNSHTELEFGTVRLTGWKVWAAVYVMLVSFGIFCAALGMLIGKATGICS